MNTNYTMTRQEQNANDFGMEYFANGYKFQTVYKVYQNGILIKEHISTKNDDVLFATVQNLNDGNIYSINFHKNKNKKFSTLTQNTLLTIG